MNLFEWLRKRKEDARAIEEFSTDEKTVQTDATFVGRILVRLGHLKEERLKEAIHQQYMESYEQRLGDKLVASGDITQGELNRALRIQGGLRSRKKHERALAMADVAEHCAKEARNQLVQLGADVTMFRKKITGQGYPAVSGEIVSKAAES